MVGEQPTACLEPSPSTGRQQLLQSLMQVAAVVQERIDFSQEGRQKEFWRLMQRIKDKREIKDLESW